MGSRPRLSENSRMSERNEGQLDEWEINVSIKTLSLVRGKYDSLRFAHIKDSLVSELLDFQRIFVNEKILSTSATLVNCISLSLPLPLSHQWRSSASEANKTEKEQVGGE